jgi:uncharacterized protein (DUF1501 family)
MNRRHFLFASAAAATGLALPFGRAGWTVRAAETDASHKKLVVIFLRGAVDGLSVVVPYGDDSYYGARRSIALKPPGRDGGVLDLDGHFGLHPALAPLMTPWRGGSLAFVQACGSPDPTRSHFDAQLYMENGTPGRGATADGWLNRLLAALPGPHAPTQALSFGPQMPRILSGPQAVANIALGEAAEKPLAVDRPGVSKAFAQLYGGDDKMSRTFQQGMAARQQMAADMSAQNNAMMSDDHEQMAANNGAPLPQGFPDDAARLARMMRQDPSIRVAFLALGGWDTHIGQGNAEGQLADRLKPLGEGLSKLVTGLGPSYQDTLIVVMSEFGRTVHENGNGGTDHGHGTVMWLLGGDVIGGKVHGTWPGLAEDRLYQQRDLAVTSDFRAILGPAVSRHLHLPEGTASALFPSAPNVTGGGAPVLIRA